jgi:VWFA-related protein
VPAPRLRHRSACLVLSALLLLTGGPVLPASPSPDTPDDLPPELAGLTFEEVSVRLVLLQATVTNRRGDMVRDLGPDDFVISEEGVAQEIAVFGRAEDHPLQIAFLLDISGSMSVGGKLERARTAIRGFVEALRPGDSTALLVFADGDVVVRVPFTTDRMRFLAALAAEEAWGRTALRDALAYSAGLLADARPGRKALVMVTDGVDNASEMTAFEAIRLARDVKVPIYTLALTGLPERMRVDRRPEGGGRSFFEILGEVAEETGGASFPVFDVADVTRAVGEVQDRLRGQYILGYHPAGTGSEPGFRRIDVLAADGRYAVATRSGYYVKP